ncbi:MAG: ATP-binding protein [Candidatus Omnitrophota bacterium]
MGNLPGKEPIFKSKSVTEVLSAFFVFFCALLIFYLDAFVGGKISFYIFYFPSIAAMAWYFGRIAGWSTVVLCSVLWFVKQWDLKFEEASVLVFWNGMICLTSFCVICWMTLAIRHGQIKLRERSQELEEFAFKAAHELTSPTANILGYTELLDEQFPQDADPKVKSFVKSIFQNVQRMMVLIKELLDYARVGKRDAGASPLDLGESLKETLEILSFAISEKKAEILVDPLPTLMINPGLAGLLFQNLIGNAMKYCEREPRIRVSAVRKGKEWLFSVKDNGIGIPAEDRERVFLMFEKLPTRRQYPGSGIGLATCQKIVANYGGDIWVESKPGEGSAFFFTLPAE